MLNGQWGLIDNFMWNFFGIDGPSFLDGSRWVALGAVIVSYIWKYMPFWTVILLAGRMAIPQELYESAEVDGATGLRKFTFVTFPLLANLYLICTLLSTIWTLGDFITVYFVSGGGPALTTNTLATLGIRDAYTLARPDLGVAAVMTALPLLIPLVLILMRKLRTAEVQL
jgi:multiple sugar transport system permease protein